MSQETQKYRVWMAVPVDVEALDEINAEHEAMGEFFVAYGPGYTRKQCEQLREMIKPMSEKTQISDGDSWKNICDL